MDDTELVADTGALSALAAEVDRCADGVGSIELGAGAPPGLAGSGLDAAVAEIVDASLAVREAHVDALRSHGRRVAAACDGYCTTEAASTQRLLRAWP
ncbi:hypothetical protein [Lolliginicoccus suaedae]|uniref:hypothetical protein n=1 Tax=Lolliginicoccus suaedae TaxID=2605429 RepID=UPI0011EE8667|nr:hypothetical protein [Lolliginicoccus suaedae]